MIVYQPAVLPGRRAEEKTLSGVDPSQRLRNSRRIHVGLGVDFGVDCEPVLADPG